MELKQLLADLSVAAGGSGLSDALDVAEAYLTPHAQVERRGGSLLATLGRGDKTVLLDAHIDEIGFIVTQVKPRGFVKVAKVGGIDRRVLPAAPVVIHGKQPVTGIFATLPPHLKKEDDLPELSDMVIDTGLADAAAVIAPGDRVTFLETPAQLAHGRITGKSLDDRAGCAALILAAEQIARGNCPCKVAVLLSDQEETGGLGARINTFALTPQEAIAVDVSFGDASGVAEEKCGKLGGGPMLGISPILSSAITHRLQMLAEERQMHLQYEAMGGRTGTNADEIAVTKAGVPCGLLSIPLRSMHTAAEVIQLSDVEDVAELLAAYCLGGGA